jgi:hypothetical protein
MMVSALFYFAGWFVWSLLRTLMPSDQLILAPEGLSARLFGFTVVRSWQNVENFRVELLHDESVVMCDVLQANGWLDRFLMGLSDGKAVVPHIYEGVAHEEMAHGLRLMKAEYG